MKKKALRNASLVALSAVMVCGSAVAFTGCSDSSNTLRVSMFCSEADKELNKSTCEAWAERYTQEMIASGAWEADHPTIEIEFTSDSKTESYFETLNREIAANAQPDVFYVSPKYVKTWRHLGRILDISEYLKDEESVASVADIWDDSIAFYAYSDDESFTQGDRVSYDATKDAYVTKNTGAEVGIYALPKDYSNFGLGFNEVFFTDEIREALTTMTTQDRMGAKGAANNSAALTYNPEGGVVTGTDGSDAPLIQIGIPTTYKPYNFYSFASYSLAVAGGDPMACMVEEFTDGQGYTVTIPGFPGDTFQEAAEYWGVDAADVVLSGSNANPEAEYDESQGYVTFTYAEYSALTWAITYYLNTYCWDGNSSNLGGVQTATARTNVYGNDQYDGTLYLLPWLAGNDASYINEDSTSIINSGAEANKMATDAVADTYTAQELQLDGSYKEVEIQYGVNSESYIETLGAFHAYGSDWNGNSNNAGDTTGEKDSGWNLFCAGSCVFYGVGTWNSGVLNDTDRQYLKYRLMPEPVSENYALYSEIKDADYDIVSYGTKKDSYTGEEIFQNQILRQNQWGARMDSVGYGVSGSLDADDWKREAAVDLVKYLTIDEEVQISLTYAGAQLPNFKSQCVEYLNKEGAFAEMITPDDGEAFDNAYAIAKAMYANANTATGTIGNWMSTNYPDFTTYDETFANDSMSSVTSLGFAMKVLRMSSYTVEDRDLSLRMQFGLNATRDSTMYTYNSNWVNKLEPRSQNKVMAYLNQAASTNMFNILANMLYAEDVNENNIPGTSYGTPAWFTLKYAADAQAELDLAIKEEQDMLGL